jgi:hypothetical protein
MMERKKELTALMTCNGIATVWFTLSLANHYWEDLQQLFGNIPLKLDNESDADFEKKWKRIALSNYANNPAIVNEAFVRRVKLFVEAFFGPDGLDSVWHWYRFEWQKRGNIHVHGLARLKSDPGVAQLGEEVAKGRKSQVMLLKMIEILNETGTEIPSILSDIQFQEVPKDDFHLPLFIERMNEKFRESPLNDRQIQTLIDDMEKGNLAELKICIYRDYLLTTLNPNPPNDATKNVRDELDNNDRPLKHPCSVCHQKSDGTYGLGGNDVNVTYSGILEWCERHRHSLGYCLLSGVCRFEFPRILCDKTRVIVKDSAYKAGDNKGELRRTKVEIVFASNDGWLNSHSKIGILGWGANIDMSILIDARAVVEYVAKYCTKTETVSKALSDILRSALRHGSEMGNLETKRVLRRAFNNLCGKRDKCTQETHHLISSNPYATCSHKFININLLGKLRAVNVDDENPEALAIKDNIVDAYGKRMDGDKWENKLLYLTIQEKLSSLCLSTFVQHYLCSKGSMIKNRIGDSDLTIPIFSPNLKSTKNKPTYYKYCFIALVKYKPWINYKEQVFSDDIAHKDSCIDLDKVTDDMKEMIMDTWHAYLVDPNRNDNLDDSLMREIDRLQQAHEREEMIDDDIIRSQDGRFDIDGEQPDFNSIYHGLMQSRIEEDVLDMVWDTAYDHHGNIDEIIEHQMNPDVIDSLWKIINDNVQPSVRRVVKLEDLKEQQQEAVLVFLDICGVSKDCNGAFIPSKIRDDNTCPNGMIVCGTAGTGKSFAIDAMIYELLKRLAEKGITGKTVLVMAPTGKAALQAGGYTLNSRDGLSVSVREEFLGQSLKGNALLRLQKRCEDIVAVIIDEYSMVAGAVISQVDDRLQQGFKNNNPFGGIPIVLTGDPGQLPPVIGLSMWVDRTSKGARISGLALKGYYLYRSIKNVMKLTVVLRQGGFFMEALLRLRDGKSTVEDHEFIMQNCAEQNMTPERINAFKGDDTMYLFTTNADNNTHNMNQIQKINEKICLIQAEHDCKSSKSRSTEGARKLANKLYVSKRSRVMLLWNVNISLGLVNGSTGHVVGFIYREGHKAPDLPYSIIIHFDDYKGPPFFTIYGCKQYENISVDPLIKEWVLISPPDKREKWVPILVSEYKWGKSFNDENPNHSRKQFPICLAWALTVWKSQGMTIKGLVKFLLGDKEKEHGLTYVGFSRVLKHEQLDIGPGCSLERLTTKISNGYRLKRRLIEDIRLDVLYDTCRIFFSN